METNFAFFSDINLIFLGLFFLIAFVLLNWGIALLLLDKGDGKKKRKGKKLLFSSFVIFFLFLLTVFVLSLVNYFFRKEPYYFQPDADITENFPPPLHSPRFPPAPEFINIGQYHFKGPWPLGEEKIIEERALYAVLCKKNQKYDILYIGEGQRSGNLSRQSQYGCWLKNCGQNSENLYAAIFQMPSENYDFKRKEKVKNDLIYQAILPCAEKAKEG